MTGNILHCLKHGSQVGWLIEPDDASVLIFQPHKQPDLCQDADYLTVLDGIEIEFTVKQIFEWLKMSV